MYIFFGQKNKRPKIKKKRVFGAEIEKKMKFGRHL